jgi:GNAT superfamily N-acetyltransferase
MADWVIERLRPDHDRSGFSCGQAPLDAFLATLVSQYEKRRLGRTYVATESGQKRVAGYYTLAAGSLDASSLPTASYKHLPKHPIPTIHPGRLAVDSAFQGKGLGETLLFDALQRALELSEKLGAFGVDLWAIDEQAGAFYQKYGFLALDDPLHLFVPMKTVAKLFQG